MYSNCVCVGGGGEDVIAKRLHIKSEYDCVTFGVGELLSQLLLLAGLNCCCRGFHAGGCVIVLHPSTQVKDCSVTHSRSIKRVTYRDSPCVMRMVSKGCGGGGGGTNYEPELQQLANLLSLIGAPSPCQLGPHGPHARLSYPQ